MRRRWTTTVCGSPHVVFWGRIARMRYLIERDFVITAAAAPVAKVTIWPRIAVVFGKVDAAVVPWVAISIKATSRLYGNQR